MSVFYSGKASVACPFVLYVYACSWEDDASQLSRRSLHWKEKSILHPWQQLYLRAKDAIRDILSLCLAFKHDTENSMAHIHPREA